MSPAAASVHVSVIIPALNEEAQIGRTLESLLSIRRAGHEVIVVDGGSTDRTVSIAERGADRVVRGPRGRAAQMNAGAAAAVGSVFLFLHADTRLPPGADRLLPDRFADSNVQWGRFDVRLSGRHPMLRVLERLISWRSRLTGIATGDQAIFVRRKLFETIGGFPMIPLMEDVALSRALKGRAGRPLCLRAHVVTSSRRWEERGIARTILLMWRLRLGFYCGRNPADLARRYAAPERAADQGR